MIKREKYLDKLRKLRDQKLIKVVTGIRRAGKSTLFKQFRGELLADGVFEKNIIYLNLEELDNQDLLDYRLLHDYVLRLVDKTTKNYVFLDEVQNVPNFEKMVDSLFVKDYIDLYITGSNAYMLSSDLATVLSGRYIEIGILPLSFSEFCQNYQNTPKTEMFADYIKYGGFPEVSNLLHSGVASEITDYLAGVYKTVLEKDVKQRQEIRSSFDFNNVVNFVFDSVGSIVSPNNIATTLSNRGNQVARLTVENYLSALLNSFVFYKVDRFDIKGKKLLQTLNKYYSVDVGLTRNILGKDTNIDRGHLIENVVFLELWRRNALVKIGKVGETEVDFMVKTRDGETQYYQVAYSVGDQTTLERELKPLNAIDDHNSKYLLTMDLEEMNYNGIRQRNIIDWLLEE